MADSVSALWTKPVSALSSIASVKTKHRPVHHLRSNFTCTERRFNSHSLFTLLKRLYLENLINSFIHSQSTTIRQTTALTAATFEKCRTMAKHRVPLSTRLNTVYWKHKTQRITHYTVYIHPYNFTNSIFSNLLTTVSKKWHQWHQMIFSCPVFLNHSVQCSYTG